MGQMEEFPTAPVLAPAIGPRSTSAQPNAAEAGDRDRHDAAVHGCAKGHLRPGNSNP